MSHPMNRLTPARKAALLLLAALVPLAALAPGTVRAAAPSMRPDMPPEIVSWRITMLSPSDYVHQAQAWRAYLETHPKSAVAHVQLSRAMRYAGEGSAEEREALLRKALELDPECPEALSNLADHEFGYAQDLEEARRLAEKAVRIAPSWPDPHFTLTSVALVEGNVDEARAHLAALLDQNGIPGPVLDFGYNLLQSAEPGGILFTNGDNDTYPPLALQLVRGVRTDVRVVNLSLFNVERYAKNVWNFPGDSRAAFTPGEIDLLLEARGNDEPAKTKIPARVLLEDLVDRIASGAWTSPVYLAITVSPTHMQSCEGRLRIEGLLWRIGKEVLPAPARDRTAGTDEEEATPIDAARTLRLFRDAFRLDSATDLGYPWTQTSSVRRLMINYPAVLQEAARAAVESKSADLTGARYALTMAVRILEFHGETEKARVAAQHLKIWKLEGN